MINLYEKALKALSVSDFGIKGNINAKSLFHDLTETVVEAVI